MDVNKFNNEIDLRKQIIKNGRPAKTKHQHYWAIGVKARGVIQAHIWRMKNNSKKLFGEQGSLAMIKKTTDEKRDKIMKSLQDTQKGF